MKQSKPQMDQKYPNKSEKFKKIIDIKMLLRVRDLQHRIGVNILTWNNNEEPESRYTPQHFYPEGLCYPIYFFQKSRNIFVF